LIADYGPTYNLAPYLLTAFTGRVGNILDNGKPVATNKYAVR